MSKILVQHVGDRTFQVTVESEVTTQHSVTLDANDHAELTQGRIGPEDLVRKSFEFLLERESNTSILRSFDLPVISDYFPEYKAAMRRQCGL